MDAPTNRSEPSRTCAKLGSAAVAEFIEDREFGPDHRLPSDAERAMIRDALERFIVHEQWLPLGQDQVELVARLRAMTRACEPSLLELRELLVGAADAIAALGQRLALQRHSREIMQEGLILQAEALNQASWPTGRADDQPGSPGVSTSTITADGAAKQASGPAVSSNTPRRPYQVKFWRNSVTADRMSIEVMATDPEAARARVLAWGRGEIELTAEEEASQTLEREELQDSAFDGLLDPGDPYSVTLLNPAAAR